MFLPLRRQGAKKFIVADGSIAWLMIVVKMMKGCRIEVEMTINPVGGCKPRQWLEELKRKVRRLGLTEIFIVSAETPVDVPAFVDCPKFLFTFHY
jgi:hypothetical protein